MNLNSLGGIHQSSRPVVPNLFYSVAPDQRVMICMAPINVCKLLDLITINYVYMHGNTHTKSNVIGTRVSNCSMASRKYLRLGTTDLDTDLQRLWNPGGETTAHLSTFSQMEESPLVLTQTLSESEQPC